jgi:hypothetical protein
MRARAEVDLKRRNAVGAAGGSANFSRKIGKRGQIVAGQGGHVGKPAAGDLDAIAGVAGEPDHRRLEAGAAL